MHDNDETLMSDSSSDAIPGPHSHSEIACGLLNGVDNLSLWDDDARAVRLVRSVEALSHAVLGIEATLVRLLDELGKE